MDKMRQEMWKRAKDRIWKESVSLVLRGEYVYDYGFRMIKEYNLIFGSPNTGSGKVKQ